LSAAQSSPPLAFAATMSGAVTEPLVALALVKAMVDLVAAVIELGVSLDDAEALLAHLATALQCGADACMLVQCGDTADAPSSGWHDGAAMLSDGQLSAAAAHGATLEHQEAGFSLFQRGALSAPELQALGLCIDALAGQPTTPH
jgi:hypothetical protein